MEKSKTSEIQDDPDFVLKHRVVGAGILLLFGALVLPWLLGPPSQASKTATLIDNNRQTTVGFNRGDKAQEDGQGEISDTNRIEDELLASIVADDDPTEEQVYISKITPLGNRSAKRAKPRSKTDAKKPTKTETTSASNDSSKKVPQDKIAALTLPEPAQSKPPVTKPAETVSAEPKRSQSKPAESKPAGESDSQIAAAVTRGWVVQVGVFTDKTGAQKVVQDLQSKGFKPSTSIVDTNRGKGTGTRVWLGPFAQRVEAAKTKTRLTDKTGEPGFIRAYP